MTIIKNVLLKKFIKFLKAQGLNHIRTNAGHEVWSRKDLLRPVIIQTHIDPIPIIVLESNLRTLGLSKKDLINWLLEN